MASSVMNDVSDATPKWKVIGPGLIVAATGVGAADLVATLIAGSKFGYGLFWCVIVGCIMKIILVEGAGRYSLATGNTMFQGWRSLGLWTTIYFAPYIVIWGFVYGNAAMAGTGLPLHALFPALSVKAWGVIAAVISLGLVWMNAYAVFEKVMAVMVGLMVISMVGAAVLTMPNLLDILKGLKPWIPDGGMVNVLSLGGGVGGTITLAAYGYWLREKGWSTPRFMRVMRIDNTVAYVVTGIFVAATLIVGAELLYSAKIAVSTGDKGMLDLSNVLADRYGNVFGKVFLVGFFAAAMSSMLGVWNGVSLMFADFVGNWRGLADDDPRVRAGGKYYRIFILWLTFPPMLLLLTGAKPGELILLYGVLGALFMPFLSFTLLFLLNSKTKVPAEWRNRIGTNIMLVLCTAAFAALAVTEVIKAVKSFTG